MHKHGCIHNEQAPTDVLRFLDTEAIVDDAEDESADDDGEDGMFSHFINGLLIYFMSILVDFIVDEPAEVDASQTRPVYRWHDLDQPEATAQILEDIAEGIARRARREHLPDSDKWDDVLFPPHPTHHDPEIWRVQVQVSGYDLLPYPPSLSEPSLFLSSSYKSPHPAFMRLFILFMIYSASLQAGCERDVVVAILSRELSTSPSGLLSAFSRDAIPGFIYIETHSLEDIRKSLQGIAHVVWTKHGMPRANLVPFFDRVPILEMGLAGVSTTMKAPSWARITRRGKYHNDLAFIREIDPRTAAITALLVPRIKSKQDRKRRRGRQSRPPAALFDSTAFESVRTFNQIFVFQGDVYRHGLLEQTLHPTDVSDRSVNATHRELALFQSSGDPAVTDFLQGTQPHSLGPGDTIRVSCGEYAGTLGYVTDIRDDDNIIIFTSTAGAAGLKVGIREVQVLVESSITLPEFEIDDRIQVLRGELSGTCGHVTEIHGGVLVFESGAGVSGLQVACEDVRRHFQLGDIVQVSRGEHEGKEGFITDLHENFAVIYTREGQNGREARTRSKSHGAVLIAIFHSSKSICVDFVGSPKSGIWQPRGQVQSYRASSPPQQWHSQEIPTGAWRYLSTPDILKGITLSSLERVNRTASSTLMCRLLVAPSIQRFLTPSRL